MVIITMSYKGLLTSFIMLCLFGCKESNPGLDLEQEQVTTRRTDQFQAVAAIGPRLVVVGNFGVWLESSDRGNSWKRNQLPGQPPFIDIVSCPNQTFVALDFRGRVWLQQPDGQWLSKQAFDDGIGMACDNANHLWAVGEYAQILTSADGGDSWRNVAISDEDLILTDIQFITDNRAVAVGEFGTQLTSTDGGQSWQTGAEIAPDLYPASVYFADQQRGWVSSVSGTLYATTDGGNSWQLQQTGTSAPLYTLVPLNDSLIAVGGQGTVLSEQNDWHPWVPKEPFYCYLRGAIDIGADQLLVAGGNGCLKVIDPLKEVVVATEFAGGQS
ncbi:MAG: YCF48-related protein [Gammaproteobacteria bacterium]